MKKLFYLFIVIFISIFFINIDSVNATYTCVYGKKAEITDSTGKTLTSWDKKLTIDVNGYADYNIIANDSPFVKEKGGTFTILTKTTEDGLEYFYADEYIGPVEKRILKAYLSLYPTEDLYKNYNGKCPPILKYQSGTESTLINVTHVYAFYNDELDSEETSKHVAWYKKMIDWIHATTDKSEGYYVLESEKDKTIEELVDNYNCATYSSYINILKSSKEEVGTCDNNAEFTRKYDRLYALCESFRATANYAEEDDEEIVSKACMRACSNLRDDVADICERNITDVKCGSLGQKIVKWIYKIIRMVRYVIPILIIILSILDYIKAIGSDADDEMKKATGKFFKRLIVAAIIFIIPFILEFILKMFKLPGLSDTNPFCSN